MSTDGVAISPGSAPSSTPGSPKSRLKFLCSHGGKILPRPSDGHLKYVGGETRVMSVPRDIPFQELMKKLSYQIEGEMTLKYQVAPEELDALVSVKSDEDLRHMLDEIDRYETSGGPRLRAFLFPANPVVMDNQIGPVDPRALEQRYIDAVNGIIRSAPKPIKLHPTINAMQHGSRVSSACSSPRSPDSCTTEAINNEPIMMLQNNYHNTRTNMHRVRSSPSICSLNNNNNNSFNNVPQQQYIHQISHHQHVHHLPSSQSPRPPVDLQKGVMPERLTSVRSVGRAEGVRYQMDPLPPHYYSSATLRQSRGNGLVHYDECGHYFDRRMADRNGSLATSPPVLSSPLRHGGRAWDTTMRGDI
ncbi:hypothetical protein PHJA_001652900 [Phtheirospermum japonicum]|uniref:PB1 domain-containing protein n=1 Tax=Phtheirospermum japonicum TaxID=374723 RepID=A0A830CIZ8_9LAMI|nr:hypothetical protein PHJA_001652900 [Phtheirospermum japonicum]